MHHKLILIMLLVSLSVILELWDYVGSNYFTQIKNPQISVTNFTTEPFSFTTLEGSTQNINDLKGKIIVLNFWATWCVPCTVEFPELIKLTSNFPKDTIFLALSVDEDIGNIYRFISRFKDTPQNNRIIGLDTDKSISQKIFQTTKFPETYILDHKGIVKRHIKGVIDWSSIDIQNDLKKLIDLKHTKP